MRPKVAVACYIFNDKGETLLGLRKGGHASGIWCCPGGHQEMGETPEETAIRETLEETSIEIENITEICFTNEIFAADKHYIILHLRANLKAGTPKVMEPEKCEKWQWFSPNNLPFPLIQGLDKVIEKYGL